MSSIDVDGVPFRENSIPLCRLTKEEYDQLIIKNKIYSYLHDLDKEKLYKNFRELFPNGNLDKRLVKKATTDDELAIELLKSGFEIECGIPLIDKLYHTANSKNISKYLRDHPEDKLVVKFIKNRDYKSLKKMKPRYSPIIVNGITDERICNLFKYGDILMIQLANVYDYKKVSTPR